MSQDAIKLSQTEGGKEIFEEKYPGYSFPYGEGAVMLEEQYKNYYNSYGN